MIKSNKLLGDLVAFRTYAKYLKHLERRESFEETINRNMQMHLDKFPKLSTDIVRAYRQVHELKVMPSMRSLQFAGDAILKNNVRLYNCSAAPINTPKVFSELLFVLLSGAGAGFSVQQHHISQLPKISFPMEDFTHHVHDSIEGWAQALDLLMEAYFYKRLRPVFNFSNIRPKNSYLVTTGAKAPGAEPLKYMLTKVEDMLKVAIGRKLKSIEIHDIVCVISDCVLSGGIRRSSLISLFDKNDEDMLKSKSGEWWINHPYRARANNSAILPRSTTTKEEFEHIFKTCKDSNSGEPGFSWSNDKDGLFNPCQPGFAKITLASGKDITFDELKIGDVLLNCENKETTVLKKWSNGIKPVYCYILDNDSVFVGTEQHKVLVNNKTGGWDKMPIQEAFKNSKTILTKESGFDYIIHRVYLGDYEVYDITVSDDTHTYLTNGVYASNCHEISLQPYQFCNLSTINQTNIKSEKDFLNRVYSATLLGTLQASYTDFPYLRPEWKNITEKEALLGVSFTGIADSSSIVTPELLKKGAKLALEVNEKYAKKIGINIASRVTTLKPEGSSSCVLASSSGIHARHSKYYLRRFRINKNDSLDHYLKNVIPDLVEDDIFSNTGSVITIPQRSPDNSIIRDQETAIDLLNRAYTYNQNWVHEGHRDGLNKNNVSCTVSVKETEWEQVCTSMWENRDKYSGISLLPFDGGSYKQAPFEECTEEVYNKYDKLINEIDLTQIKENSDNTQRTQTVSCSGGVCELVDI